jgi:hypothetical protein
MDCLRDTDFGDELPPGPVEREASFDSLGFALNALKISTGKSAIPIERLAIVPNKADAPPVMGSHGPSSVSYSRGR